MQRKTNFLREIDTNLKIYIDLLSKTLCVLYLNII